MTELAETPTPRTDALQAEFNLAWQKVAETDAEAANRASRHADKAMAHARTLERELTSAKEAAESRAAEAGQSSTALNLPLPKHPSMPNHSTTGAAPPTQSGVICSIHGVQTGVTCPLCLPLHAEKGK